MKLSPSIWHYVVSVKQTVKISSIIVAFLENTNFNNKDSIYEGFSPTILKSSNILYQAYVNCIAHKYDTKKTSTRKGRFMFTSRKLVKVIAIAYYYSHWSKKVPHSEERAEIKMLFSFYSMLINFFFAWNVLDHIILV